MTTPEKLVQMVIAVAIFYGVVALILLATQRLRSRSGERVQAAMKTAGQSVSEVGDQLKDWLSKVGQRADENDPPR